MSLTNDHLKSTKAFKCLQWLRDNPQANRRQALAAGWSNSTYHLARSVLNGSPNKYAQRMPMLTAFAATLQKTSEPQASSALSVALAKLTTELLSLEDKHGVPYVHYEHRRVTIRMTMEHSWEAVDGAPQEG